MNRRVFTVRLISMLLASGSLVVAGCTDNDYDFDQIDAIIGIGGDGLELPASSTADIKLKDVLDLEEDGVVVEDEETHNYVLRQTGTEVSEANPRINTIIISRRQQPVQSDIVLSLASGARGSQFSVSRAAGSRAATVLKGEADIYEFSYEGNKPSEVLSMSAAEVNSFVNLKLNLSSLSSVVSQIDKFCITFPAYMEITVVAPTNGIPVDAEVVDNQIIIENLSTSKDYTLGVGVVGLDFSKSNGSDKLGVVNTALGDKIQMSGKIHASLETSHYSFSGGSTSAVLSNTVTMEDVVATSVTGKFNPQIDLSNLGYANITGVPDFLKDGNVVVDLYNPVIQLDVESTLEIEGKVSGKLVAVKDGQVSASVDVPEFTIHSANKNGGKSHIYICRTADGLSLSEDADAVVVPKLSDLVKTIPDVIRFECDAHADTEQEGTFRLGHTYRIKPSYSINAPIAFAEDAVIEYNDTFDGWNDDIKDYQLAKGGSLELTAQVSNGVPAFLNLEATPIDAQGNEIAPSELEVAVTGNIAASQDGVNPATSPLSIKITQLNDDALKKLDGIRIKVLGKASSEGQKVTGITLNAERHTLKLNDIKVKLVGKVIADLN